MSNDTQQPAEAGDQATTPAGFGEPLDFSKADFGGATASTCAFCQSPVTDAYWDVNGQVACERCQTQLVEHAKPVGFDVRLRGLAFGLGAAILGGIGWGVITRASGYEIGLVAIAVGWFVGMAIARGTGRRGGRLMQVAAVVLAYLAVVSQYVYEIWTALDSDPGVMKVILTLGISVAAPFLIGVENILGIAIICFGLWEAWKQSASIQLTITGPHALAPRPPAEGSPVAP